MIWSQAAAAIDAESQPQIEVRQKHIPESPEYKPPGKDKEFCRHRGGIQDFRVGQKNFFGIFKQIFFEVSKCEK